MGYKGSGQDYVSNPNLGPDYIHFEVCRKHLKYICISNFGKRYFLKGIVSPTAAPDNIFVHLFVNL